ncbi:MAG TPA: hypothetical protein VI432_02795 [Candidatus Paceibacterota bacterium]
MLNKKIFKNLIYPTTLIVFISISVFIFIKTSSFLYTSINRSFNIDQLRVQSELLNLDLSSFNSLKNRLGIEEN